MTNDPTCFSKYHISPKYKIMPAITEPVINFITPMIKNVIRNRIEIIMSLENLYESKIAFIF